MAILFCMAITPTCKVTYSLKPETVERVQELATQWGVAKSEVIRRAVAQASATPAASSDDDRDLSPLEALEWLSKNGISKEEADRFNKETRRERRAWGRKRG